MVQVLRSSSWVAWAALAMLLSPPVQAEQLRFATGYPPGAAPVKHAESMADIVAKASGGELTVRVFTNALLSFAEMSAGVRDGITDVGYVVTPYFPSEYPRTNLLNDVSMQLALLGDAPKGREGVAYGGALMEYVFFNCPECQKEYFNQDQVFTGVSPTASYQLLCNRPVVSAADMNGLRLRAGAGQWSRWAQAMGATPIQISGQESLEGMKQGLIDCTVLSVVSGLSDFRLIDAATHITSTVPGGVFAATPATNINASVWRAMSEEKRRAFLAGAVYMAAAVPFFEHQREREVLGEAKAQGIVILEADADLQDLTRTFIEQDATTVAQHYATQFGVQDAEAMIAGFQPVLARWVELVKDVGTVEDLVTIYEREIYSKIDVSTYGM
ncbi:C4-dicarboxylate ABC transporter substrate-binding protein [Paracoccus sp. YIM 132242]|uniref:C4-dicarboxylate ABC transporter substrate-binding protein n=1 Tax=Paracoccus lichenicola TaxID=2665644 RepID=A0A6L6HQI3_9RHOB|nr:C4-dicarboxylate TRAP transporter substrate-binding protein [Paracoccus lichenicola]MTE00295.1 C4-dicarboxylate ABC transporter substrate-binding protein [Paracoccus lichenicola]